MLIYRSTTCIPCTAMGKLVEKGRAAYELQVAFVTVLTDERANTPLVRRAGIQAIATSLFVGRDAQATTALGAMDELALRVQLDALKTGE